MATLQETMAITDRISGPMLAAMNSIQSVLNVFGRLDTQLSAGVSTEFANEIHAAAERSQRDINNLAAAFAGLSDTPVRAPTIPTVTPSVSAVPRIPQWQIGNSNEWFSSNWDRQIKEASSGMFEVAQLQNKIESKAAGLTVLNPQAQSDIGNVGSKIAEVHALLQQIKNNPLNINTEEATRRMSDIRARVEQIYSLSGSLDIAIDAGNVSQANAAFLELNENISNVMNTARDMLQPIKWQSDTSLEVFNTVGIERWQQEVTRADSLVSQLGTNINTITQNAAFNNILPPNAAADMTKMNERIGRIQQRVQELNSRPANVITDAEIREVEQLSQQLNQALQIERQMTAAAQNMDVSAANAAYQQLSQTIGNAERMLRDNTSEQQNFNNEVRNGQSEMDKLTGFIKKAVGAFVSLQTVKKVIDISDQMTSTTARLNLLIDTENSKESIDELQAKIFNAAQNARGLFNDMASFVARVGNNAGKAFTNNDELIKFAELVQKEFAISGASVTEAQNASIQLSQALGAGVLRGQDLNSVFSQAPELIKTIAKGLDIDIGQIRSLAAEGEITAQQVKNAILGAAGDIDKKFNNMPMTWGQAWQSMKNSALMAFKPVFENLNGIVNSSEFQAGIDNIINSFSSIANTVIKVIKPVGGVLTSVISIIPHIVKALSPAINIVSDVSSTISEFIENNMDAISAIVDGIGNGIGMIFSVLEPVVDFALNAGQLIIDNWSAISPILLTAAAAVGVYNAALLGMRIYSAMAALAQQILNVGLLNMPIFWVVAGIAAFIGIIGIATKAVNDAYGLGLSFAGMIGGSVMVVLAALGNVIIFVEKVGLALWDSLYAIGENIFTFFHNRFLDMQTFCANVLGKIMGFVEKVCEGLNKIPFIEFDYSGVTKLAEGYVKLAAENENKKLDYTDVSEAWNRGWNEKEFIDLNEAFEAGYDIGDKLGNMFGNQNDYTSEITKALNQANSLNNPYDGITGDVADIADNTADISDSVSISEEDLKYLRDIAERDVINRFTTAEISVNMGGITQTVNERSDLDGIIDYLAEGVRESMTIAAEGVH